MLKEQLLRILSEYQSVTNNPLKENELAGFIRNNIPETISQLASIPMSYKVQGSPGKGNWAEIPWIGLFDKEVTTSAERGYYIVYLFDAQMQGVYLSLNQGYVQYKEIYTIKNAEKEIRQTALKLQEQLRSVLPDFNFQPISLHPKNNLGRGYELGHICGKFYSMNAIPDDAALLNDLRNLIGVYRELKGLVGKDILHLKIMLTEEERYQYESNEAPPVELPEGPLQKPDKKEVKGSSKWMRDRRRAKSALLKANYRCEIDPTHYTFTLASTGKKYMEPHHLIPMEQQSNFDVDIDVPENIVSICPNCHRLIHLAVFSEKIEFLQKLYKARTSGLKMRGINLNVDQLVNYYC